MSLNEGSRIVPVPDTLTVAMARVTLSNTTTGTQTLPSDTTSRAPTTPNRQPLGTQSEFYMTGVSSMAPSELTTSPPLICSICLDPLGGELAAIRLHACGHTFHATCIIPWFDSSAPRDGSLRGRCPNCRCELYMPDPPLAPVPSQTAREASREARLHIRFDGNDLWAHEEEESDDDGTDYAASVYDDFEYRYEEGGDDPFNSSNNVINEVTTAAMQQYIDEVGHLHGIDPTPLSRAGRLEILASAGLIVDPPAPAPSSLPGSRPEGEYPQYAPFDLPDRRPLRIPRFTPYDPPSPAPSTPPSPPGRSASASQDAIGPDTGNHGTLWDFSERERQERMRRMEARRSLLASRFLQRAVDRQERPFQYEHDLTGPRRRSEGGAGARGEERGDGSR